MASLQVALDAKNIEVIPGMGLSLGDVLKLVINYWQPTNTVYRQIKANLGAAIAANNAQDICKILTGGDFADALVEGLSQVLINKLNTITSALPSCSIDCSGGGPSAANVAKAVLTISVKSFDGDGVSFGTLIAEVVTNIVCCAVQMGVNFAIKKIGTGRILGKLRERCAGLLSQGASTAGQVLSATSNAGYGNVPAPQVQIDAAAQTVGQSVSQTTLAQARAVEAQVADLRTEMNAKTSGLRNEIYNLENVYLPEFQRLLVAAQKAGDRARINELNAGLTYIHDELAKDKASLQQMEAPYETQIAQLTGHATAIRVSGGVTSDVNWKPLQVAAGTAAVGAGLVLFSPVVAAAGALALVVGLFRMRKTP